MTHSKEAKSTEEKMSKNRNEENVRKPLLNYCIRTLKKCDKFLEDIYFYDEICKVGKYIASKPILLVVCCILISIILIPLVFFITFALISTLFAFIGLIVIQAAVLAVGATFTGSLLLCIVVSIGFLGLCILTIYYIGLYTKLLIQTYKE